MLADQLILVAWPLGTYAAGLEVDVLHEVPAVLQAVMLSEGVPLPETKIVVEVEIVLF